MDFGGRNVYASLQFILCLLGTRNLRTFPVGAKGQGTCWFDRQAICPREKLSPVASFKGIPFWLIPKTLGDYLLSTSKVSRLLVTWMVGKSVCTTIKPPEIMVGWNGQGYHNCRVAYVVQGCVRPQQAIIHEQVPRSGVNPSVCGLKPK